MVDEAFWEDGATYDAAELRRLLRSFYSSPDPLGGIIYGLAVVQGAGSTIKVKTGAAFIFDTGGGAYIGATQADSAPLTITPASGSPRTDRVYAVVTDPGAITFGVSPGSTSIPGLAIPLADVTANVDGSLTITDRRVQVRDSAEKNTDTLWVSLTPLNGWATANSTDTGPLIRRIGNVVHMVGTLLEPWDSGQQRQVQNENNNAYVALQLPAWATPTYTVERVAMTGLRVGIFGGFAPINIAAPASLVIQGSHTASHPQILSGVAGTRVAGAVSIQMPFCGSGSSSDGPNAASLATTWLAD